MRVLVRNRVGTFSIDLDVAARIVIDGPSGLWVDALGPREVFDGLGRLEELTVEAVEHVIEAIASRVRDDFPVLAVDFGIDEDVAANLVVVVVVIRRVLEMPRDPAVRDIEGDRAVGVKVVARTIARIVGRNRIARTPIGQIGRRIISAGAEERAAAGLPGIVVVFPGFAAGFAGRWDGKGLPFRLAGLGIERCQPVAQAAVAAGAADHDRILERERRGGEFEVRLVEQVLVPHDLVGLLVGRDDAARVAGHRNDEIAPERDAAIAILVRELGVHFPHDRAGRAGAHVNLVNHAPAIGHVHEPIVDQWRRFEAVGGRLAGERNRELEF